MFIIYRNDNIGGECAVSVERSGIFEVPFRVINERIQSYKYHFQTPFPSLSEEHDAKCF